MSIGVHSKLPQTSLIPWPYSQNFAGDLIQTSSPFVISPPARSITTPKLSVGDVVVISKNPLIFTHLLRPKSEEKVAS